MRKLSFLFRVLFVSLILQFVACKDASVNVSWGECEAETICTDIPVTYTDPETQETVFTYERACQPNPLSKGCVSGGGNCSPCDPDARVVSASLTLQNNETCPVTTTHSNTYETPGCWCNIIFVGRRCCHCLNNCYTTDTWTTTEQVPAPPYGSCP